jgi:transcriptional regulator with XRE-family HTH domain
MRLSVEPKDLQTLKELRSDRGSTQAHLAMRLGLNQAALSRLESRADLSVSMLRSYVEALGGSLELTAVFQDARITLSGLTSTETREDLLALLNQQCYLHPMPDDRKTDLFLVSRVDEALIEVQKLSNAQRLEIPIRRVLEVLPATSPNLPTIVLRGKLEWSAHQKLWKMALD